MRRFLLGSIGVVFCSFFVIRCGKGSTDATTNATSDGTSFISTSKSNFPACNSNRAGYLAYAEDESKFYTCDGTTWSQVAVGTQGPAGTNGLNGTGVSVYDKNGVLIGSLGYAVFPSIGIVFGNSAFGEFSPWGTYTNGRCYVSGVSSGGYTYCSPSGPASTFASGGGYFSKSYPFFSTGSCTGTPYISAQPIKNSLFRVPTASSSSGFMKATGTETASSITPQSVYFSDLASCGDATVSGAGICCSISAVTATGYGLSGTYSFPSAVPSYPFSGPFYFQ